MSKLLSEAAVEAYRREGYVSPVRVLSDGEAGDCRRALEAHEARTGGPLQGNWRHKTHLLFTWADALVHHPRLIVHVDEMGGVPLAVVRLAAALGAVGLARQLADLGRRPRGAQEGGQFLRQRTHRRHPDQPAADPLRNRARHRVTQSGVPS